MKPTEIIHQIRECAHVMCIYAALLSDSAATASRDDRGQFCNVLSAAAAELRKELDALEEVVRG